MIHRAGSSPAPFRVVATLCAILVLVLATLSNTTSLNAFAAPPAVTPNPPAGVTVITVNTTLDQPNCADATHFPLYCAINQANHDCFAATAPCDVIQFNIAAGDSNCSGSPLRCTITPANPLPTLTGKYVTIDGYSQPSATPNTNTHPLVDGDNAKILIQLRTNCLTLSGSNQTVQGLSIGGCTNGVTLSGADHALIAGNYIGVASDGVTPVNNSDGVILTDGTTNSTVGGTLTGAPTSTALGVGAVNVLSHNFGEGNVVIKDGTGPNNSSGVSTGNTVKGNIIGPAADAVTSLGIGATGILASTSNLGVVGVVIGGTTVANGANVDANLVADNYVGVNATTVNGHTTVSMLGNYVGVSPTGTPLGNDRYGVVDYGANLTLGAPGDTSGAVGNTVAYSGYTGIYVSTPGAQGGNSVGHVGIYRNAVYASNQQTSGYLNLDLADGNNHEGAINCTANSPPVANDGILCPVITGASTSAIDGTACAGCTVDVYRATNGFYDQNHGGSRQWLGEVTADACNTSDCPWHLTSFAVPFDPTQQAVTATATQLASGAAETSEFATDLSAPDTAFSVTTTADSSKDTPCEDTAGVYVPTLRCALSQSNVSGGTAGTTASAVHFTIPPGDTGCASQTINGASHSVCKVKPVTALPVLTRDNVTIDGYSQPGSSPNTNLHPLSQGDNAVILIEILGQDNVDTLAFNGAHQTVQGLSFARGNNYNAVDLLNNAQYATVQGNFMGPEPDGSVPPSSPTGVVLHQPGHDNTIGGTLAPNAGSLGVGAINVITGDFYGVSFTYASGSNQNIGANNVVKGNFIGINPAATSSANMGDMRIGIGVNSFHGATIGGTTISGGVNADANLIGGQDNTAVAIGYSPNTTIQGNFIGVGPTGTQFPVSGYGIQAVRGSTGTIGGTSAAAGNTFGYASTVAPVSIGDGTGFLDQFAVEHNSMFGNGGKVGITLVGQDPSTCTTGPTPGKPNDYTPCPTISSVTTGKVSGQACSGCTVDLYIAAGANDNEGKTWIGSTVAGPCNGTCTAPWTIYSSDFAQPLATGDIVTATSTTAAAPGPAETSEFGAEATAVQVQGGGTLVVNTTQDLSAPCQPNAYSLRCAISDANGDGSGDTINFNIAGCAGVCMLQPTTPLPALSADHTTIDGYSQPSARANTHPLKGAQGDNAVILVQLDGSKVQPNSGDGIVITNAGDTVRGLSITGFVNGAGIHLNGSGVKGTAIGGNFIGIQPNGATAAANLAGILADNSAIATTVGGVTPADENVVSGNSGSGIKMGLSSCKFNCATPGNDVIQGNAVGTDAAGSAAVPNGTDNTLHMAGIDAYGAADTIGGPGLGAGNLVSGNAYTGIHSTGNNTVIQGNIVGTNAAGDTALGNGISGTNGAALVYHIGLEDEGTGTQIGGTSAGEGNLVSGNGLGGSFYSAGLAAFGYQQAVQGNFVGTDITGTKAIPNHGYAGLYSASGGGVVGGTTAGARNLISGNASNGLTEDGGNGEIMEGNYIGTDVTGTKALPNTGFGVYLDGGGDTLGGTGAGAGNLISGNDAGGVKADYLGSLKDTIQGNLIGVDATGMVALPNTGPGMDIMSTGDQIGGTAPGAGNVIGGNTGDGIDYHPRPNQGKTAIQGNLVGVDASGSRNLGNGGNGIHVYPNGDGDKNGTQIDQVTGNTVANNGATGILVGNGVNDQHTHVVVSQNRTFANAGLGIDLIPQGTVDCANNATIGPNDYIHCPTIGSATTNEISGTACNGCTVEVFIADGDPSGNGEGKVYLGSAVADLQTAVWDLKGPFAAALAAGQAVTATATAANSPGPAETSEFAPNVTVTSAGLGPLVVTTTKDLAPNACTLTDVSLRCAMTTANKDASGDTISFRIPAGDSGCTAGVCLIILSSALPVLSAGNTTIDGYTQPGASPNTLARDAGDNAVLTVRLNGSGAGNSVDGITLTGSNDVIKGLSITTFHTPYAGVGGNAIHISGAATGDQIVGNFLGLAPDGTTDVGNESGVMVDGGGKNAQIGSSAPADRNLIASNFVGVWLRNSSRNTVQGNYFSTDRTGTVAKGNFTDVQIEGEGATKDAGSGDMIGGADPAQGNVMGGGLGWGISAAPGPNDNAGATNAYTTIANNSIGTNAAGTSALKRVLGGMFLSAPHSFTISSNTVAGNQQDGILITGPGNKNAVTGNSIGVGAGGVAMGNGWDGLIIRYGESGDTISGNTIANNGRIGVHLGLSPTDVTHELISRNSFFSNTNGGIILTGQSADSCFFAPTSGTPNDYTPCPLIKSATTSSITGEACAGCTVEVYTAPTGTDDEGQTWLGTVTAPTCAAPCSGITSWTLPAASYATALGKGQFVTATASTATAGSTPAETSQFSWEAPVGVPLTVTTTADKRTPCTVNAYSLRCAVERANKDGAGDTILFKIPAADPGCKSGCVLALGAALPAITAPWTSVNARGQAGSKPNTLIPTMGTGGDNAIPGVSLSGLGIPKAPEGLAVTAAHVDIEGLAVGGFTNASAGIGIHLTGANALYDIVAGNFIGATRAGTTPFASNTGVVVDNGATGELIGLLTPADTNLISGNKNYGIELDEGGKSYVMGNLIGTNAAGTAALPNGYSGMLLVSTDGNKIGGATVGAGNVISGNTVDGIDGVGATNTTISQNRIGNDAGGKAAVANGLSGIYLYMGANNTIGGTNNAIGGALDALGNAIGGNGGDGIDLMGEGTLTVSHNTIGTGATSRPNTGIGVLVSNPGNGITARHRTYLPRPAVTGGHRFTAGAVLSNTITGNGGPGVQIGESAYETDVHVLISRNSMSLNAPGIRVVGTRADCSASTNRGPNDTLACPIITVAHTNTLQGTTCKGCSVELFVANMQPADNGHGEGFTQIGTATVSPAGGQHWGIGVRPGLLRMGQRVTAVSIRPQTGKIPAESSEFSPSVLVNNNVR